MPRRKSPYPEKPWSPDPVKWQRHLEKGLFEKLEQLKTPDEPVEGWLLYRLDDLSDVKQ